MTSRLLVLFAALLLPFSAFAKTPLETMKAARERLDKILSVAAPAAGTPAATERRGKLEAEAKTLFTFAELSKRALDKNWTTGSAAQQKEFVTLFSYLILNTYLTQTEGQSSKGFALTWGKETVSGSEASVTSTLKGKTTEGKPVDITVEYKLIMVGSDWMVYDVVTDKDSLLVQYKGSFSKMFKKEKDFEGVLKKLRSKSGK